MHARTPSKLPRTPTHVPPVPPLPHGVRTEPRMGRSVSAAMPPRAARAVDAVPERPRPGDDAGGHVEVGDHGTLPPGRLVSRA